MFTAGEGSTRIEVRSVWFLLLYASGLLDRLTAHERDLLASGERDNDLLDALAEILARQVERRVRFMLARGYRSRIETLNRVRGRIDHLGTARGRLMESGRILCRYNEQTVDLPRYRFMLVTLRRAVHKAESESVRRRCLITAQMLERNGVSPFEPTMPQLSKEQYGHFDAEDRKLVLISRLVRDMCAPEHAPGEHPLPSIARDEHSLRKLFESAVRSFYRFHLGPSGYRVAAETRIWPAQGDADSLAHLPRLEADVVIRGYDRQTIVECKFAPMFDLRHGRPTIKPAYLRQIYAYASVFSRDHEGQTCAVLLGALVNGSPGRDLDLVLDGVPLRVRQIDLAAPPSEIRLALAEAVNQETLVLRAFGAG